MFRCPDCGQGKEISFKGKQTPNIELIMTNTMDKPEYFRLKELRVSEDNNNDVYDDLVSTFKEADKEQEVECPSCNEKNELEKWKDAHADPLKYFEMENSQLCHCGGELWMDRIPNTNAYGFVCEKCNWVKPNQKVSGA